MKDKQRVSGDTFPARGALAILTFDFGTLPADGIAASRTPTG